jgi:cell division protein YceG involved in septum cleavage
MKIFRLLAILAVILVCGGAGFSIWLYRELHRPVAHSHATQYVEIPRGSTPDETIARLTSSGIIGRDWPLARA